ncbi:MAG: cytochrome c maturation protein CcmE [Pseudomonadota bacterium]|jgi:cytochrome c-type biogenesis protein CcmE
MKPRHIRTLWAIGALTTLGGATLLVLNAFEKNLVFFYTPTQVFDKEAPTQKVFRVGGLVEPNSVARDGVKVRFNITDNHKTMTVTYQGILPDLFKEGKGIVAQGRLQNDQFVAQEVLAKHDENYMPPEAAEALKKAAQQQPNKPLGGTL